MDETAYFQFLECERTGLKREAKRALARFVDSFESAINRDEWAADYLRKSYNSSSLGTGLSRHQLSVHNDFFVGVLWPYLKDGHQKNDAECLYFLSLYRQNFFARWHFEPEIKDWDVRFIERAFALQPHSIPIRAAMLAELIADLAFTTHSWPEGCLFWETGKAENELSIPEKDLILARQIDVQNQYPDVLDRFATQISEFRRRLGTVAPEA